MITVYLSNISAHKTSRCSTYICASFATRRLSTLTTLRVPRCNDANIDIVTSYKNLLFRLSSTLFVSEEKERKEKLRKRERETHQSKHSEKEEAKESLFTQPMTELIETMRSGTSFSIFKDASSGAFLRYFCRRRRTESKLKTGRVRKILRDARHRCTQYRTRMSRGEKCQLSIGLKPSESKGNSRLRCDEMVK